MSLGKDLFKWFNGDLCIDARFDIGIEIGPLLRRLQAVEFGHDKTATESRLSRIFAIDRRVWACNDQSSGLLERLKPGQMFRTDGQSFRKALFYVFADNGI
jgi:hypothetical protein